MTGNGYVLRGNTVSNNRGRGTILKGSQGMVENNRFTYNHFAGVLVRLPQNPTLL
jgi:parallel beta-helix repeat protein